MPSTSKQTGRKRLPTRNILSCLILFSAILLCACSTIHPTRENAHRFAPEQDGFSFANQLAWNYGFEDGKWTGHPRQPPADYAQHCFVMTRAARQFFLFAQFEPAMPKLSDEAYELQIHRLLTTSDAQLAAEKIVIPGFQNLHELSEAKEALLKRVCGGAWRSYLQRGNWRMVFPFTRGDQQKTAERLAHSIDLKRPPIIHVVTFPHLTLNHSVLILGCTKGETEWLFEAYDPNEPGKTLSLRYDVAGRQFIYPRTEYFFGGSVNVYEVYRSAIF